jgi:hypothetical protein
MHFTAVTFFGLKCSFHYKITSQICKILFLLSKVREPLFSDKKTSLLYRKTVLLSTKNPHFKAYQRYIIPSLPDFSMLFSASSTKISLFHPFHTEKYNCQQKAILICG